MPTMRAPAACQADQEREDCAQTLLALRVIPVDLGRVGKPCGQPARRCKGQGAIGRRSNDPGLLQRLDRPWPTRSPGGLKTRAECLQRLFNELQEFAIVRIRAQETEGLVNTQEEAGILEGPVRQGQQGRPLCGEVLRREPVLRPVQAVNQRLQGCGVRDPLAACRNGSAV